MKKILALALATLMCVMLLAACATNNNGGSTTTSPTPTPPAGSTTTPPPAAKNVALRFVNQFGGEDGNAQNMKDAIAAYEAESGNTVNAEPGTANEEWKARVLTDFETGSDPDVLQYFSGVDSDPLISANKIVSLDEIRAVYPDYAANIGDGALNQLASPVDGKIYCVPTNGFWEGIFCNQDVLDANGIKVPETWDEFLAACEKLKSVGVASFAVAVNNVPHYTFEFLLYNYAGKDLSVNFAPKAVGDAAYKAYINALNDFKTLYEKGYLPENTLTAIEVEAKQLFNDKKAAFLAGGQWDRGSVSEANTNLDGVSMISLGTKDASVRPYQSYIGGYSVGLMITRKCWEDLDKRDAAVKLVQSLTNDANIAKFAGAAANPSKTPAEAAITPFEQMCVTAVGKAQMMGFPAEDGWTGEASAYLYNGAIGEICQGKLTPEAALEEFMKLNQR